MKAYNRAEFPIAISLAILAIAAPARAQWQAQTITYSVQKDDVTDTNGNITRGEQQYTAVNIAGAHIWVVADIGFWPRAAESEISITAKRTYVWTYYGTPTQLTVNVSAEVQGWRSSGTADNGYAQSDAWPPEDITGTTTDEDTTWAPGGTRSALATPATT